MGRLFFFKTLESKLLTDASAKHLAEKISSAGLACLPRVFPEFLASTKPEGTLFWLLFRVLGQLELLLFFLLSFPYLAIFCSIFTT